MNKSERRYDMDWLRVLAVLLLIPYHGALPFVPVDWYIKDNSFSIGLSILAGFIYQWHMPLLFFLSGAASWFSMGSRTKNQYIRERFLRLLIPFIFGLIFIVPPQVYLSSLSQGQTLYENVYLQFHHDFLEGKVHPVLQWSQPPFNIDWAHLWFIAYLFVFSLIALPIFSFFRSDKGTNWITKLVQFTQKPWAILFLGIPMATIEDTMRPFWPGSMNLYILHQTIMVVIAFFVVRWNIGIGSKYTIISLLSLVLTLGFYEFIVRRINLIRFFFGMKPKKVIKNARS